MRVATDGISRQLDWISEASKERIADDDLLRSINEWIPRVRTAARRRNSVLHGMWRVDPWETSRLANTSAKPTASTPVEDLHQISVTFAKLADDTVELSDDIGDYFILRSLDSERGGDPQSRDDLVDRPDETSDA